MEFRPLTPQERLKQMDLLARSLFFTYDRKKYEEEATGEQWMSGRGAFDAKGRLVACMNAIPFEAWFDGKTVGMGGVGGVVSEPDARRSGSVQGLILAALNEMRERGDVFSYLYPFSYVFYRKFGYEVCMRLVRINAPLEPLHKYRGPGRIERFVPGEGGSDPAPIVEVYNDFAKANNLSIDRQGWRWRGLLEQDPVTNRRHTYVWYGEDGAPGAYLLYKAPPDFMPPELQVLEAAWRSRESLYGLLGFIGGLSSNLTRVVWDLPPALAPELIWPELVWQDCHDLKSEVIYAGMCRVVNAQNALYFMVKPQGGGSVTVGVADEDLPGNTGVYKIEWESGESNVRRLKAGAADLECSIHALAQLVTGYLPLTELQLRQDIKVNGKTDELNRLFARKSVYMADRF